MVGYWAVDDIGTVINPMIAHGQIHGGIAQGIGQALLEHACMSRRRTARDRLADGLRDPRAHRLPGFVAECDESQPCTHNPLGAKGCGEAGAIAAPAAMVSAALDALVPLGVSDLDMPLTSEQIWRRIRNAGSNPSQPLK